MNSHYPLAKKIIMPARAFRPGADVATTIREAKKKGPLVGPVREVKVAPYDLMHPDHPRRLGALV